MQSETQTVAETKLVTVTLPVELNRRVNVLCAMMGVTKQKFFESALLAEVERAESAK